MSADINNLLENDEFLLNQEGIISDLQDKNNEKSLKEKKKFNDDINQIKNILEREG